jgi:hypothetical protein
MNHSAVLLLACLPVTCDSKPWALKKKGLAFCGAIRRVWITARLSTRDPLSIHTVVDS